MADTSTCAVCRTPIHRTRVGWEHDIVAMGEWAVTAHHAACPSEPEVTTEHEALCARQDCGWAKNTARHDPCWLKVGFCGTPACHRFEPFKAVAPPADAEEADRG